MANINSNLWDLSIGYDPSRKEVWHVSLWNDPYFKPLAGIRNQTYPQNFGWSIKGSSEVLRITDLTTSRVTKLLTYPKTKPPNCQKAWEALLSIPQQLTNGIPWEAIWRSMGSFLTSPRDESFWWRLLQTEGTRHNKQIT